MNCSSATLPTRLLILAISTVQVHGKNGADSGCLLTEVRNTSVGHAAYNSFGATSVVCTFGLTVFYYNEEDGLFLFIEGHIRASADALFGDQCMLKDNVPLCICSCIVPWGQRTRACDWWVRLLIAKNANELCFIIILVTFRD